jgi:ribonuclease-3
MALGDATRAFVVSVTGFEPIGDAIWIEALTHGSTGEKRTYERLEFLGDRVLGLSIAEWLSDSSDEREGALSQRLNALVSGITCAEVAREFGVAAQLRLGKQARDDGGEDSDNILGDAMEALIGACFRERGFEGARAMVRRLWSERVAGLSGHSKHPKSALQEWAAGNRRKMPQYRLVERSGPDHAARFTVEVSIKGVGEAEAAGSSKQDAETAAAEEFMRLFG